MPIYLGTNEIDNLKLGSGQCDRVYKGTNLVWEYIQFLTGNLYTLTSNTTPSPYVASALGTAGARNFQPYNVFDFNDTTAYTISQSTTGSLGARIKLGANGKIAPTKIKTRHSYPGGGAIAVTVTLRDASLNVIESKQSTAFAGTPGDSEITFTQDFDVEYIDILSVATGGFVGVNLYSCQVIEWYEKA